MGGPFVAEAEDDRNDCQHRNDRGQDNVRNQEPVIQIGNRRVSITREFGVAVLIMVRQIADQKDNGDAETTDHRNFVSGLVAPFDQDETDDQQKRRQAIQRRVDMRQNGIVDKYFRRWHRWLLS